MECVDLTDDELWRAIADNTNALSLVAEQREQLDAAIAASHNAAGRTSLMRLHLDTVNRFHRDYRAYTAELRRRHGLTEQNALDEQSDADRWMQTLSESSPGEWASGAARRSSAA